MYHFHFDPSHVQARVGETIYNGTFFSREGVQALVFYAGIPEEGAQALTQTVLGLHVHHKARTVRRDGTVYFYPPLTAA